MISLSLFVERSQEGQLVGEGISDSRPTMVVLSISLVPASARHVTLIMIHAVCDICSVGYIP